MPPGLAFLEVGLPIRALLPVDGRMESCCLVIVEPMTALFPLIAAFVPFASEDGELPTFVPKTCSTADSAVLAGPLQKLWKVYSIVGESTS